MKIDLGDITWDGLHCPETTSSYENFLRLMYYKWVYPFAERANDTRIGHVEVDVAEDGEFSMKFVPRFKLSKDDIDMLTSKVFMQEQFPPNAEEMKQLAAEKEAKWKAESEKWRREHPASTIDLSKSMMKSVKK